MTRFAAGLALCAGLAVGLPSTADAAPRSSAKSSSRPAASRPAAKTPARSAAPTRPVMPPGAFVPGTGTEIPYAGDDFEQQGWSYIHRHPKSSREQDQQLRGPLGRSANDRWNEGPERGEPDQLEVVPTPAGGLPGSQQALLMRTLKSGIPGYTTNDVQQDDLISNMLNRIGTIPVGERPSVVARVWLPPFEQWEQRSGPQFGFRTSASTVTEKTKGGFFAMTEKEAEPYWPGMWIHYRAPVKLSAKEGGGIRPPSAYLTIRADRMGRDYRALEIPHAGWYTLGISYTPDGKVHYFASAGVDELTAADYLGSQWPYSYTARQFRTYFFDVCNLDNGRNWSTAFVIDDPKLYLVSSKRVESIVARRERASQQMAKRREMMAQRAAARAAGRQKPGNQRTASKSSGGNAPR
jgi:hypothetical protein